MRINHWCCTLSRLPVLLLLLVQLFGLAACKAPPAEIAPKSTQLSSLLGEPGVAGYAQALEVRDFSFPADHGPHPDFRSEWWYWTGNLQSADGRAFGYQFTVFRFALAPQSAIQDRPSQWGARDTWLAHLTVSDIAAQKFYAFERAGRGALDLAGATAAPFRVHCDGWEASEQPASEQAVSGVPGTLRIRADAGDVALDLTLAPGKPRVLQGERGLSRKGAELGNASYYYSQTRMPTTGTLRVLGNETVISGNSWMDREWSTSALAPGVVGWDWVALQLTDGREVMLYRLRRADGSATEFSSGVVIEADGSHATLTQDQFTLTAQASWTSRTGVTYPAKWRLQTVGLDLKILPAIADQELDLTVRYWEGAVMIIDTDSAEQVGVGYVELAGY